MTPGTIKPAERGGRRVEGCGYRLAICGWVWSSTGTRAARRLYGAWRQAGPAGPAARRQTLEPARDPEGMALWLPGA
jgi:hypothetical protein